MSQETENQIAQDPTAHRLDRYAQNVLVVVFGLLPLLFLPFPAAPFEFTKIFLVIIALAAAIVLESLSILRAGKIVARFSFVLLAFWAVVVVALVSAFLSGDLRDALIGDQFGIHTFAFVVVLALTTSMWSLLNIEKVTVMRLYIVLAASTMTLVIFHLVRLVFGPETLSFGILSGLVSTPIGSWNDLALFFGLSVLLSLVALEQLPLTRSGKMLFGGVAVLALFMLGVINFFMVWLVLGLVSLVILVYTLGKEHFTGSQMSFMTKKTFGASSLPLALIVFVTSVVFIIGGSSIGAMISKYTGISYVEVRPSLEATTDIARQVYEQSPLFGVGPNKFVDAWRLYKDQSINSTIFWNTEFNAGNGYLTTFFVTTGVLGGLAWIVFLVFFTYTGARLLMIASDSDRMWYFIGTSSFVTALYIWGMSLIYVPGAVMLLLGALCTGLTIAAQHGLGVTQTRTLSIINNRRAGFALTLVVIAIIIGSVSATYVSARQYKAVYDFNENMNLLEQNGDLQSVIPQIESAYETTQNDLFLRRLAEYEMGVMNSLMTIQNPSLEEQKRFESSLVNAVNWGRVAVEVDPGEPGNWNVLATLYSMIVAGNRDNFYELGKDAFVKARAADPKSPLLALSAGIFESRAGNPEEARRYVEEAITLKPNYVDAFFFLSQLDISTGNIESAIGSSRAMIQLEPQNPSRYYQLGVLEAALGRHENAARAFEEAIKLDTNFANARYLLAFSYDELKRPDAAKAELEKVLELNPGNENVLLLIDTLEANKTLKTLAQNASSTPASPAVDEQPKVKEENGTVITDEAPDSSMVKPVNTVPTPSPQGNGGNEGATE